MPARADRIDSIERNSVPAVPSHVRHANTSAVLSDITRRAITLAVWDRPSPLQGAELGAFANVRFEAAAAEVATALRQALATQAERPWFDGLVDDVAALARLYADVMGVAEVEIRLDRLEGDACWRFHADFVSVRLISTYIGRGTEWLDQDAARAHLRGEPVRPHAMPTGSVGLFKGQALAAEDAIVHRSPPIAGTGEERLLLVIDPVRRDD